MAQVEQRLLTQIIAGPEQAPVSPEDVVAAAADDRWIRVLLALTDDTGLHAAWARELGVGGAEGLAASAWTGTDKLAWIRAEIDDVDGEIDAALQAAADRDGESVERAGAILDALARQEIGWAGDALRAMIESLRSDEQARERVGLEALAMVAGLGEPGALRAMLHEAEVVDDVVSLLRGAALMGHTELWDQFLIWQSRLDGVDDADETIQQVEGAGAVMDPVLFARSLIGGDVEMGWAEDSRSVADFLQVWGPTDWLEVAALLEHGDDTVMETASVMAVNAARGIGAEAPESEEAEQLIELLEIDADESGGSNQSDGWEPLATELGLQFQIAVGATSDDADEDESGSFGRLLAQIAAHERLVYHGIHSPGIPGLPLSATSMRYLDLEATTSALRQLAESSSDVASGGAAGEECIRAVRTLCDLGTWLRREPDEIEGLARQACEMFSMHHSPAIRVARAQIAFGLEGDSVELPADFEIGVSDSVVEALVRTGASVGGREEGLVSEEHQEALAELADGESLIAMDAGRRLGTIGEPAVRRRLADLWVDGPVCRASFFRQLLLESIRDIG